jgi:hypothetical protein
MSTEKSSKMNTFLLSICMLMLTGLGVVAWDGLQKADAAATGAATLQVSVNDIKASLMPREEIAVQIKQLQENQDKIDLGLLDCRTRMDHLEIEMARISGRAMSPKEENR